MGYKNGDSFTVSFSTCSSTGAATNADSTPTGTFRKNGTNDGTVTVTVTNNTTGDYTATGTIPSGYAAGDRVELLISATISTIVTKTIASLGVLDKRVNDVVDSNNRVDVIKINGTSQTARDNGASVLLDFTQALPSTPAANSLGEALFVMDIQAGRINVAQGGTTTTLTLDASASAVANTYIGDDVYLYGGTGGGIRGSGQRATVTGYNATTKVVTVHKAWATTPDNTTKFIMLPSPKADAWIFGGTLSSAAALSMLTTGKSDLIDAPNATAVTAIQSGLATSTALATAQTAINNTYGIVNSGSFGNSALLSAIQNVQNNTFVATSIPQMLERPDSSSTSISITIVFSDETGAAKNLDSGNPTITLVNDAGTDRSSRLGSITNPATGKYIVAYTNTSTDTIEGLHWDITGTLNSKLRRMVAYTQIINTTAVDFTSADRTALNAVQTQAALIGTNAADSPSAQAAQTAISGLRADYTTPRAGKLDNLDQTIGSRMATFSYAAPDNGTLTKLATALIIVGSGPSYQFTTSALANAPSGGGGGSAGNGDTPVNENTGGTDNLRLTNSSNIGIDNASITAYLKSEWDSDALTATARAQAFTMSDGRWATIMMLNSGLTYTFVYNAVGYVAATKEATI